MKILKVIEDSAFYAHSVVIENINTDMKNKNALYN